MGIGLGKLGGAGKRQVKRPALRAACEALERRQLLTTYVTLSGPDGTPGEGNTLTYDLTYYQDQAFAAGGMVTLSYGGSATAGQDYEILTTSVTIPANPNYYPGSWTIPFSVRIKQDNLVEGDETLTVSIGGDSPGLVFAPYGFPSYLDPTPYTRSTVTIADDPPRASIGATGTSGNSSDGSVGMETDPATGAPRPLRLIVSRFGGDLNAELTVSLQAGSASTACSGDYSLPSSITFAPGETSKPVEVGVINDSVPEWTKTLVVEVTGSALAEVSRTTAYILDDDRSIGALPGMLLANNDDDNSNGVADMAESTLPSGDDDAVSVALGWPQELKPGCVVSLSVTGPLQLYTSERAPIGLTSGTVSWTIGSGQAPPRTILVAANGGVTQVDGAALTLSTQDATVPRLPSGVTSAPTKTTPVLVSVTTYAADARPATPEVDVLVGQWIQVGASATAPEGWIQGTPTWSATGTRYREYHVEADNSRSYLVDFDGEWTRAWGTAFYWVDGEGGQTVTATLSLCGASLARTMRFAVYKPTATLTAEMGRVEAAGGDLYITDSPSHHGIDFRASATMPPGFATDGGEICLVQKVRKDRQFWDAAGKHYQGVSDGIWMLDTSFPYGFLNSNDVEKPTWPTGGDPGYTRDSPSVPHESYVQDTLAPIDSVRFHAQQDFEMYLLFRPKIPGAQWVPLRTLEWSWSGTSFKAPLPGGEVAVWQLENPSPATPTTSWNSTLSADYPLWDKVTVSGQPVIVQPTP